MGATSAAAKTKQVRVARDLAIRLAAVSRYEGLDTAEYLDPLLRKAIERRFAALPPEYRAKSLRAAGLTEGGAS